MPESPNLKNTANNFLGVMAVLVAAALFATSIMLFADLAFLKDVVTMTDTARYIAGGGAAAIGLGSALVAGNRFAQPMNTVSKKMDEEKHPSVAEQPDMPDLMGTRRYADKEKRPDSHIAAVKASHEAAAQSLGGGRG